MVGATLAGRYRITGRLGEGGMAVVYRAQTIAPHPGIPDEVAIKVLHHELASDRELAQRFRREAKLASTLRSPHAVRVFEGGVEGEVSYMIMELVDGRDLLDLLEQHGRISERRAAAIIAQVCDALSEAHRLTIVHRDLTPDNVMLVRGVAPPDEDYVKVIDFGIAKILDEGSFARAQAQAGAMGSMLSALTVASSRLGTPAYMSPEQGRGEVVEPRTDLYACGLLLFELITGRPPFEGETPLVTLLSHVEEPPPPPSDHVPIHPELERLILQALAKFPDERPPSAAAMGAELRRLLGSLNPEVATRSDR
jgi:eukaryotic-like serine/threonine-protein kinase